MSIVYRPPLTNLIIKKYWKKKFFEKMKYRNFFWKKIVFVIVTLL